MTKKDYIILARALAHTRPNPLTEVQANSEQWRKDVKSVAQALAANNPRFNIVKFIKACCAEPLPPDFVAGG